MPKKKLDLKVERRPRENLNVAMVWSDPIDAHVDADGITLTFSTGGDTRGTHYTIRIGNANMVAMLELIGRSMELQHERHIDDVSELHYRKMSPAGREIMDRGN